MLPRSIENPQQTEREKPWRFCYANFPFLCFGTSSSRALTATIFFGLAVTFKPQRFESVTEADAGGAISVARFRLHIDGIWISVATRLATKDAKFLPLKVIAPTVEIPVMVQMLRWHEFARRPRLDLAWQTIQGISHSVARPLFQDT